MAKDMHNKKWDEATITKLDVFESYLNEWLNVSLTDALKYSQKDRAIEIYDLCCGSGFDATLSCAGTPVRILNTLANRNLNSVRIKLYFNDINKNKTATLKAYIEKDGKYSDLLKNSVEITYENRDVNDYSIKSKAYFKLIFLDQYGVKFITKIDEFIKKGTDMLMFIASSSIKRFKNQPEFKKYFSGMNINFNDADNYKTHIVVSEALRKIYEQKYRISYFSLIKNETNTNGLLFITTHKKGRIKFLEAAWKVDPINGEANKNTDKGDIYNEKGSLFACLNVPSFKQERYVDDLKKFLKTERTNVELSDFSLSNGFLYKHTHDILKKMKNLEVKDITKNRKNSFYLADKQERLKIRIKDETD